MMPPTLGPFSPHRLMPLPSLPVRPAPATRRHLFGLTLLSSLALLAGCGSGDAEAGSAPPGPSDTDSPRSIIVLIGDGMGAAYFTAARLHKGELAMERMEVGGLMDQRSATSLVTGSAEAATALATGVRTYGGAIGVGLACPDLMAADSAAMRADPAACDPLEGVFDVAHGARMSTGLVASSSVTHATPAGFGAKVPRRGWQAEIANQYMEGPIQVILGGGQGWFDGRRGTFDDDRLTPFCAAAEVDCLLSVEEFEAHQPSSQRRLVGLFAEDGMPRYTEGRSPSLPAMTRMALDVLAGNPSGFVLMVEGSQPDWLGHANAPFHEIAAESADFDDAVEVALDFQDQHPDVLVLVLSDHETGGLALLPDGDSLVAAYSSTGHTGEMVPLFAHGPGAMAFGGIRDNDEIGGTLVEMVRRIEVANR
ncbi:MAG: alkaline phosphatase [Gemmatimonadales bacterium]|nr:MAG: alkaline phosphatase [Gemmatimonadales bacterium]